MIQASVKFEKLTGYTVIVSSLPKHGETINVHGYGRMRVSHLADRWGKNYIYLISSRSKVDGYVEIKS